MKALVVGANGPNAGLVVPTLVDHGVKVRGMVRSQAKAEQARKRGADEVVVADLRQPDTVRAAMDGVDAVFHVNPAFAPDEAAMGRSMVEAAMSAGIQKFVFSSVYHPSLSALANHADKQPVESALYESGLNFTILQPAMFMQNLAGAFQQAVASGQLIMPYSAKARVCYVDFRDVAEAAAIAMTTERLDYGTFELAAEGMVDRYEIAALMTSASGRQVVAGEISVDEWLRSPSMPHGPLRDGLATMMRHYDQYGFVGGNALILQTIVGREPRSLAAFIRELA